MRFRTQAHRHPALRIAARAMFVAMEGSLVWTNVCFRREAGLRTVNPEVGVPTVKCG
jgi:hypothetical protein